jgi:general secretion pathway protein L
LRILGIDLGSHSIKAVELDSAFGRYEIHDYHEIARTAGQPTTEALAQLVSSLSKKPDRVVVALRSGQVTFRNLTLPTRDKKAISSGVGFELEDELPFSLDDAIYDYSVLNQSKQATYVHVAATLKKHLAAFLTQLDLANVDADIVTTEAWAYRAFMNRTQGLTAAAAASPADPAGGAATTHPVLLVHVGHERTTLYLHFRNAPVLAREIAWGGRDLTMAICQRYQIPFDQAEATKLDNGFVVPAAQRVDATAEQLEFSDTLFQPLQELLAAIRQAELSCKNVTHVQISQVYFSGGTAQLPGLIKVLEENLGVPVRPIQALSSIATSGVTYNEQTDAAFLLAASLALSVVGTDRASNINLRKGDFAKVGQTREINYASLKKPLLAVTAIAVCFIASLGVQSRTYKAKIEDVDAQLKRNLTGFFGPLSTSAVSTYMSNTTTLKSTINKDLTKQRELGKLVGPNPHSPLDFLREISQGVPRDVVVDMTQYQVGAAPAGTYQPAGDTSASLTFVVSNPAMAERLATALTPKIGSIQRGPLEESTGADGTKKWKITFSGKPTEDSYGK